MHRTLLTALAVLLVVPSLAAGQGVKAWTLELDNDGFSFWDPPSRRSDGYYTHGLRLEAALARTPPGIRSAACAEGPPEDGVCYLTRISLGQQIYTPGFVFGAVPSSNDHPYAGFLYGELEGERVDADGSTTFGLRMGVTGPPSLGQEAHQGFHRWLGKAEPQGWEYQIPFELAFALAVHRTRFWTPTPEDAPVFVAVLPRWGATLGTLRSSTDAGLAVQLGLNARPGVEWQGPRGGGLHAVAEVSLQGELVFRDIFIDGATFAESMSTERDIWVDRRRARLQLGAGPAALEFTATRVSPRFRAQPHAHTYGTVRLIVRP